MSLWNHLPLQNHHTPLIHLFIPILKLISKLFMQSQNNHSSNVIHSVQQHSTLCDIALIYYYFSLTQLLSWSTVCNWNCACVMPMNRWIRQTASVTWSGVEWCRSVQDALKDSTEPHHHGNNSHPTVTCPYSLSGRAHTHPEHATRHTNRPLANWQYRQSPSAKSRIKKKKNPHRRQKHTNTVTWTNRETVKETAQDFVSAS